MEDGGRINIDMAGPRLGIQRIQRVDGELARRRLARRKTGPPVTREVLARYTAPASEGQSGAGIMGRKDREPAP